MINRKSIFNMLLLLPAVTLVACSQRPWVDTRLDALTQEQDQVAKTIKNNNCVLPIDGNLQVTVDTPLKQQSVSGYLALLPHSHSKFVVSSPIGQPLYIVTENDKEWQIIDVINGRFQQDEIGDLINGQNLPIGLAQLSFSTTILGGLNPEFQPPFIIRADKEKRGLWYTAKNESVLVDNDSIILARVLEDENSELLEINYDNRQTVGHCSIPQNTNISGLDYGTTISLKISNMKEKKITKQSFVISPPAHFRKDIILPTN